MSILEIILFICVGALIPFAVLFIVAVCIVAGRESRKEEKDGSPSEL